MVSRAERGAYGEGTKITDWDRYNPLGVKTKPFPTETVCPLCDSKREYVFPVTLEVCYKDAERIMERTDVFRKYLGSKLVLNGQMCLVCGKNTTVIHKINTRICQKCTVKLGRNQKRYQSLLKYARKVA